MAMVPEIKWMLQLQERDQRIRGLEKEVERIPRETMAAEARLKGAQDDLDTAHAKIQANEVAMKNLELDIETRRGTIARLKIQQYETKKNGEFTALANEVARYSEEVTALEDQELELMELGEILKKEHAEAEATRDKVKEQVEEEVGGHGERTEGAKARIGELHEERKKLASELTEDVNAVYDRILKSKGDSAVAALEHGVCAGCHMKVTKTTLHDVRIAEEIAHCQNCGRVLYWVD